MVQILQGGHRCDQLPRDPQAPQSRPQQNRDRNKLPVRSEHRVSNPAEGGKLWTAMVAAGEVVGHAALRVSVSFQRCQACLQDAQLCLYPQGTPVYWFRLESALVGVLRPVQSGRRSSVPIHPIQQVLRRLFGKDQYHHAFESQVK